jgi:hypothetical protein
MRYNVSIPCVIPRRLQLHDAPTVTQVLDVEADNPESALSAAVARLAEQFPALSPMRNEALVQAAAGSGRLGGV